MSAMTDDEMEVHDPHPYSEGLNERTIVVYDGLSPRHLVNLELDENGDIRISSETDVHQREFVRVVRRHTAENHDGLTIIPPSSPLYRDEFDNMKMGEERIF